MHPLVQLLAAAALLSQVSAAITNRKIKDIPVNLDVDNSIDANAVPSKRLGVKRFVRITTRPPPALNLTGASLELTCEAMGSPAPSIQWLRDHVPVAEYDHQSNELFPSSSSVGRAVSTLIVKPTDQLVRTYTCSASAGQHSARAATRVYTHEPNSDLSERYKLLPFEPKIVSSYKAYLDNIGKMAVLPCRVKGHPRPRVVWRDNNGEVVRKKNARMRVFRSGELQISRLAWADMGDFTCTATNHFGTATAKTFVYPVAG